MVCYLKLHVLQVYSVLLVNVFEVGLEVCLKEEGHEGWSLLMK